MAREYGKALTKEMLQEWGIEDITWDVETNNWLIDRYWYKNNSKSKRHVRLSIQNAVCKHKYSTDKSYPIVTFSYNKKAICLPLARIVYAWVCGPIESREVIDHKDNNPYNNYMNVNDLNDPKNNLQKLSVGENLAKRFIDNVNSNKNQYTTKVYKKAKQHPELYNMVHEMYIAGESYEEALAKIYEHLKEEGEN